MATRKGAPARPKDNSVLRRLRKARSGAARSAAYRGYAAELLENVRRRYEETPEPAPSLAADLGIMSCNLYRLARTRGWVRRSGPPPREMSSALRLLEEARALDAGGAAADESVTAFGERAASPPPLEKGRSTREARRVGIAEGQEMSPTRRPSAADLSLSGGGTPAAAPVAISQAKAADGAEAAPPTPPAPSTLDRLERAVLAELATIEAMRAALGTMPQKPPGARETVRTLSMLTQTLQIIQRLRASAALKNTSKGDRHDDDDLPTDIDEFRRELARRIRAFVASRTGGNGARRDAADDAMDPPQS
jgi:hypothetical protein